MIPLVGSAGGLIQKLIIAKVSTAEPTVISGGQWLYPIQNLIIAKVSTAHPTLLCDLWWAVVVPNSKPDHRQGQHCPPYSAL
ncbi:hypothetical protein [Moorena sp. SIO4G3]|uniref:hypothetical protein n=1 Tax=Moorena sp. SIO4G3 TaxID=2607821 RepID=UPI00142CA6F6|nr:hypothetical protein [Moorena sp. SIO4G3]NEO80737.1 hypothetical protein [Moorena sp. SIO4G3]